MPTVSGHVYYSPNNTLTPNSGIQNVPVVLYNPGLGIGATVLTDAAGAYTFINVPAGSYQLVESWGALGGAPTPVDFLISAVAMPTAPVEKEPPLSALSVVPPALADFLMAISPNLLNVTVAGVDITGQDFYDAPVGSKPVVFNGITMVGGNLITAADNGSFGSVAAGSPVNTIPAAPPYPTVTPGLPYQAAPEITDGHYSIVNIRRKVNTSFAWWNLSDHETMLETGRFMFVNGDQPGAILFTQIVPVTPNTNYTITGWGLNLLDVLGVPPKFAVEVLAPGGSTIGYQDFNSLQSTAIPVWYQAGFLFNSGANTSVTVNILSTAPFSRTGNDYAIDEIRMFRSELLNLLSLQKSFSPAILYNDTSGVGMTSTVTVVVTNTSTLNAPNTFFQDILDPQLQFVPGSVMVNGSGVGWGAADPNFGFSLGDMAPGAVNTVTFQVTSLVPGPVIIPNTATATYDAARNGNGDVIRNTVSSNAANLQIIINKATLVIDKTVNPAFAAPGDLLTYTLNIKNTGNVPATNIVLADAVPAGTTFVAGSVTGATGAPPSLTMTSPIPAGGTATVTFQVLVDNVIPAVNPIPNIATAAYNYTIDPTFPNGGSGASISNIANTLISKAIVTAQKTGTPAYSDVGGTVSYTITLTNTGNVAANNVVLTDVIPAGTTFVPGSLVGATGTPPTLTLTNPLAAGDTSTVTFDVLVGSSLPNPNPLKNSVTAAFTYTVDPAKPNAASGIAAGGPAITQVNTAKLVLTKGVDKTISYVGDVITYQISVKNTGNVPANNVVLTDLLPTGVSLVPGSLNVSVLYGGSLAGGLTLTNPIAAGQTVVLTFKAHVDAMPSPNPIANRMTATYSYTVDPAAPDAVSASSASNTVNTIVFRNNFAQQVSDLVESVALEQAALAAIAQAEGAKIQRMSAMGGITAQELLCLNKSVAEMMESITMLEAVLKQKLNTVGCQLNGTGSGC